MCGGGDFSTSSVLSLAVGRCMCLSLFVYSYLLCTTCHVLLLFVFMPDPACGKCIREENKTEGNISEHFTNVP